MNELRANQSSLGSLWIKVSSYLRLPFITRAQNKQNNSKWQWAMADCIKQFPSPHLIIRSLFIHPSLPLLKIHPNNLFIKSQIILIITLFLLVIMKWWVFEVGKKLLDCFKLLEVLYNSWSQAGWLVAERGSVRFCFYMKEECLWLWSGVKSFKVRMNENNGS